MLLEECIYDKAIDCATKEFNLPKSQANLPLEILNHLKFLNISYTDIMQCCGSLAVRDVVYIYFFLVPNGNVISQMMCCWCS